MEQNNNSNNKTLFWKFYLWQQLDVANTQIPDSKQELRVIAGSLNDLQAPK